MWEVSKLTGIFLLGQGKYLTLILTLGTMTYFMLASGTITHCSASFDFIIWFVLYNSFSAW